ncbi:unnamed protein product [Owenia fusiformis]|uniref:Uncharacterized protein n=1 Tax=Owenia fusiformis TaxID=6347 RepID=A0A8J1UY26_OWEFU|nr:unnamed protein product [Owenia fusiformis]
MQSLGESCLKVIRSLTWPIIDYEHWPTQRVIKQGMSALWGSHMEEGFTEEGAVINVELHLILTFPECTGITGANVEHFLEALYWRSGVVCEIRTHQYDALSLDRMSQCDVCQNPTSDETPDSYFFRTYGGMPGRGTSCKGPERSFMNRHGDDPHRLCTRKGPICRIDIVINVFKFKEIIANTDQELRNHFNLPFEASIESRSKLVFMQEPVRDANLTFIQPGDVYSLDPTTSDRQPVLYEIHAISPFSQSLLATRIDLCFNFCALHRLVQEPAQQWVKELWLLRLLADDTGHGDDGDYEEINEQWDVKPNAVRFQYLKSQTSNISHTGFIAIHKDPCRHMTSHIYNQGTYDILSGGLKEVFALQSLDI